MIRQRLKGNHIKFRLEGPLIILIYLFYRCWKNANLQNSFVCCKHHFHKIRLWTLLFYSAKISIYKVVISVCLLVCPIITHEPFNRFASNFDLWTKGMFLGWFKKLNMGWILQFPAKLGSQASYKVLNDFKDSIKRL